MTTKSYNNFAGGYTREQAIWSEDICHLIEGSRNIDIFPKQDDGYGIKSIAGNKVFSTITGKSIYNLQEYDGLTDKYFIAHTGDTVQEYNESTDDWAELKTGLTVTATSASLVNLALDTITVGYKRHLLFFTNGIDAPFIYEKGETPAVQDVTATGVDGHTIRGHIAVAFDQRIFIADGSTLYWSKQLDPFNFSTAEDAGYKRCDGKILGVTVGLGAIVVSTSNGFLIGISNNGIYTWKNLSTNQAYNHKCLIPYSTSILFYSTNGLYPIDTTQANEAQTGDNFSFSIDAELFGYSEGVKSKAQLIDASNMGRDEVWLHIPTTTESIVYIFRKKKGHLKYSYWLPPRYQQPVNCFCIFKNNMYSGASNGKILKELSGNDFDGTFKESVAVTPKISFDNYSGKIKCKPVVFLDAENDNNFYIRTITNGDNLTYTEKKLSSVGDSSSLWGDDSDIGLVWDGDGVTNGGSWAISFLNRINLDKAKSKSKDSERSIQFKFLTKALGDTFSLHAIDLTKIRKTSKW